MKLPSGVRSCMRRWAHNAGTGGSKILPFWNCANVRPRRDNMKQTLNTFMVIGDVLKTNGNRRLTQLL